LKQVTFKLDTKDLQNLQAMRVYVKSLIAEVMRKNYEKCLPTSYSPEQDVIWRICSMLLAVFRRDTNKKRKSNTL